MILTLAALVRGCIVSENDTDVLRLGCQPLGTAYRAPLQGSGWPGHTHIRRVRRVGQDIHVGVQVAA